jgi:phosphoglycerate kinase
MAVKGYVDPRVTSVKATYKKRRIDGVDVNGKRVFIRANFDEPMDEVNNPGDRERFEETLMTINFCLRQGAKSVVLCSHTGSEAVAQYLGSRVNKQIQFLPQCVGPQVEAACADPAPGSVFLLDDSKYFGEGGTGKGVEEFAASLTNIADIYCNDDWKTSHLAYSSMVADGFEVKCSGYQVAKELEWFRQSLDFTKKPVCAVVGGTKLSDKIQVIDGLLPNVDTILIGGSMALEGIPKDIMEKAKKYQVTIQLPTDFNKGDSALDCGPETIEANTKAILDASTVICCGTVGDFESEGFEAGTKSLMDALMRTTKLGRVTVLTGDDTIEAISKFGDKNKVTHCSLGSEASLQLMAGTALPGVVTLNMGDGYNQFAADTWKVLLRDLFQPFRGYEQFSSRGGFRRGQGAAEETTTPVKKSFWTWGPSFSTWAGYTKPVEPKDTTPPSWES